jgi:hypothetical protein
MSGEGEAAGRRVDAYLQTVSRLEPDISMTDPGAYGTSMAISLKRIADQLSFLDQINDHLRSIRILLEEEVAYRRARE